MKNFKQAVTNWVKSAGRVRDKYQELLAYAHEQAKENNFDAMSTVITAGYSVKSMPMTTISRYVQAYGPYTLKVTNGVVKASKNKSKDAKAHTAFDKAWFEWDQSHNRIVNVTAEQVIAMVKRIVDGEDSDTRKISDEARQIARKMLAATAA